MRSRPSHRRHETSACGITSACAEQTPPRWRTLSAIWDHLRVCGADRGRSNRDSGVRGSPPRVRSRLFIYLVGGLHSGITSACAEQTRSWKAGTCSFWDHLRVCGADRITGGLGYGITGSPPRVRSRHDHGKPGHVRPRITSACAEQTWRSQAFRRLQGDHLRVCGADLGGTAAPSCPSWITSACAEQTATPSATSTAAWDHLRVCGADGYEPPRIVLEQGSPPRVRSRPRRRGRLVAGHGITSACAEQTQRVVVLVHLVGDHLRVCGADEVGVNPTVSELGSPPRVRSRPVVRFVQVVAEGITSACAEQTSTTCDKGTQTGDHLRVCGADKTTPQPLVPPVGSPPRVRSRPAGSVSAPMPWRITSACAEQTAFTVAGAALLGDHLRVCGADCYADKHTNVNPGSPPRVRSRLERGLEPSGHHGITSACAEQTHTSSASGEPASDHLRVCGADLANASVMRISSGSPPRVRSRQGHVLPSRCGAGITSACAEQTSRRSARRTRSPDHLRVCGADEVGVTPSASELGSPPRVRSRHHVVPVRGCDRGITSACAEQTSRPWDAPHATADHLRVCGADELENSNVFASLGSPPRVRSRRRGPGTSRSRAGITSACAEQTG